MICPRVTHFRTGRQPLPSRVSSPSRKPLLRANTKYAIAVADVSQRSRVHIGDHAVEIAAMVVDCRSLA